MKRARWEVGPSGKSARRPWRVTRDREVVSYSDTQRDAILLAVLLCRKRLAEIGQASELFIKGRDGKVREARTYGADPRGVKG